MPTSEPCKRCLVSCRGHGELLCPEILPGHGRGAQAPRCHLVMSSAGGLPGPGAVVTRAHGQFGLHYSSFCLCCFPTTKQKKRPYWASILLATYRYFIEFICLKFRITLVTGQTFFFPTDEETQTQKCMPIKCQGTCTVNKSAGI